MSPSITADVDMSKSIYDHEIEMYNGSTTTFGDLCRGKVAVVVNVASKCGFTPQYKGLQELYNKYKDDGLEILAFPCNQFGGQEPGSASDIRSFTCEVYKTTFPFTAKVDVNGEKAHPLYQHLKVAAPYSLSQAVWWNFEKMIVNRKGEVVSRYGSTTIPAGLQSEIESLLAEDAPASEKVAVRPASAESDAAVAGGAGAGAAGAAEGKAGAESKEEPEAKGVVGK